MRASRMNQETTAAAMTAQIIEINRHNRSGIQLNDGDYQNRFASEYIEELIGSNPEQRNWKGIAISVLVIMAVVGLVVLSVILLTPENTVPVTPKVNAADVSSSEWKSGLIDVTWQDSSMIYQDQEANLVKMTSVDQEPKILIPKQIMKDNGILEYKVSKDNRYALLMFYRTSIYTYSCNASYYIYNIKARTKEPFIHEQAETVFQSVDFGPNGSQIVYSLHGDLFYKPSANSDSTKRLTSSGRLGTHQNGIADWLYEEEILKASQAFWWSPSGRYLAFASFDDRNVDEDYITVHNDDSDSDVISSQWAIKYKYPKAGRPNPVVNIHVVNVDTMKRVEFSATTIYGVHLEIFQSLTWMSDDEILVTWSDRTVETSVMQQCSPKTLTCVKNIITQYAAKKRKNPNTKQGWLPYLTQKPLASDDKDIFFYILPHDQGGMGEFHHLVLVNKTSEPTTTRFLTSGNWEVAKLLYFDASTREVYYISNEAHLGSRHVYTISAGEHGARTCHTCGLCLQQFTNASAIRDSDGEVTAMDCGGKNKCRYYDASFGSGSDWFAVKCLGPRLPYTGIVHLQKAGYSKMRKPGKFSGSIRTIRSPPKSYPAIVPMARYETLKKGDREIRLKALVPASIHDGKRPVVFFKGDVGSQTVDFRYQVDLASYIVTTIGAVAIFVDGRGAGFIGNHLLQQVAGRPGSLEIEDMKVVLEYLKTQENVDTESVGIVGTSGYGGYTAALALGDSQFKCGVARSPVTDWELYDSYGAEKLLGSPTENSRLYQKSSLTQNVKSIGGSQLRIYQGMQDRKVNMQHSVLLKQAAMLGNLPPEAVQVTYHPSPELMANANDATKIETKVYESIDFFLRNCLFGNSEQGRLKLELLEANYGIEA